ncbi:GCN5 family acetyltransferase [Ornatilinea apprima]|uniref:GCN5 family acetyltransferase n=1 Tax=Ornatilinea apprima TaxID=1134406 RepID=A0A0P6XL83_9CHLR|nr:N-acetyltransferase [Ornatilinea apprima]KPL76989.1 GCN5 family acetyltransferase [Ornatilinea apprima]
MNRGIKIRKAAPRDVETLAFFNTAMAWETEGKRLDPETITRGLQNLLRRPELGYYLVAELDGEVAGALMITTEWSDWRNGLFWWIQSVYVRPEYRRQGVFKRLFVEVENLAHQEAEVCGLRLYVEHTNHTAQRTYRALGMQESGYRLYEKEFDR